MVIFNSYVKLPVINADEWWNDDEQWFSWATTDFDETL